MIGETTAVVLAAGLGSRLGPNTSECPKCLVPVSGVPILERLLETLRDVGVPRIVIAVGYLSDQIRRFAAQRFPDLEIRFVENSQYASTGSVYSLDLALDVASSGHNLLLVEGDVVLDPALLARVVVAAENAEDAVTLLAPYEPALSGTFALVDEGFVSAWTHESVRADDFPFASSFKTVNITFVKNGKPSSDLREAVKQTIATLGSKAPLEYAMQDLVATGLRIGAVETGGLRWFEVDTPEDLVVAERLFSSGRKESKYSTSPHPEALREAV